MERLRDTAAAPIGNPQDSAARRFVHRGIGGAVRADDRGSVARQLTALRKSPVQVLNFGEGSYGTPRSFSPCNTTSGSTPPTWFCLRLPQATTSVTITSRSRSSTTCPISSFQGRTWCWIPRFAGARHTGHAPYGPGHCCSTWRRSWRGRPTDAGSTFTLRRAARALVTGTRRVGRAYCQLAQELAHPSSNNPEP